MDKNTKERNRKLRMKTHPMLATTINIIEKSTFGELILRTKTPPLHTERPVSLNALNSSTEKNIEQHGVVRNSACDKSKDKTREELFACLG